ncbi:vesicular glutamate transporter 1 [Elysia marginata]|uniref:Vesicular glutamate transporter 1 n=1 Tax=Elysia marginata TaxID=1093978 RepID=A0AAV4FBA3_9GAST|nr:vesicular glutamate transporter 1 [Elysia marginata]
MYPLLGCQLGTVLVTWSAGIVCEQSLGGGWPFVFYLYGGVGVAWSLGWLAVVHESPDIHPRISRAERKYIEGNVGQQSSVANQEQGKASLGRILRSPAFIAIVFAHFAQDWGLFALTTCLPSFMQHILKYDLQEVSLVV